MLTTLLLATVLQAHTIEARHYEIRLAGPVYEGLIHFHLGNKHMENLERRIHVYVAGGLTRCDTDKRVSVYKAKGEYVMLDHMKKVALVFPKNKETEGREAVCRTTPFWPEAYGDATSLKEIESRAEAAGTPLRKRKKDVYHPTESYFYIPRTWPTSLLSSKEMWEPPWFAVSTDALVEIHNLHYSFYPRTEVFGIHWAASHKYAPGADQPTVVQLEESLFALPEGYTVFLAAKSPDYPTAKVLDAEVTKSFVWRFHIPIALPKSLLDGS